MKNLELIATSKTNVNISKVGSDLAKEIQSLLQAGGFYSGKIDGIPGKQTQKAFADFKTKVWLSDIETLGPTTAAALLELTAGHKVSEQASLSIAQPIATSPGSMGVSMKLVTGETVYQHQEVFPGTNITWGEFTKGCDPKRSPESKEVVDNIIYTSKKFGLIREKFNAPIRITSGYRPIKENRRVGGATRSQHLFGLALDIAPLSGNSKELNRLWEVCVDSDCVGLGRGMHRGFIHVDWRNRGGVRVNFSY